MNIIGKFRDENGRVLEGAHRGSKIDPPSFMRTHGSRAPIRVGEAVGDYQCVIHAKGYST